jgi:hypothetical protein
MPAALVHRRPAASFLMTFPRVAPRRACASAIRPVAVFLFCLAASPIAFADARICASADTLLFGNQPTNTIATRHASVSNCGDAPFAFTGVFPDASNGRAWQVSTGCATGQSLAPGMSCAIDVTFAPTVPGQTSGGLWLHNSTLTPDQLVTFYGRGIDAQAGSAALSFTPDPVQFSATPIGQQVGPLVVTVRNVGTAALTPSALVINGADPYDFRTLSSGDAADCAVGVPIAAGASCRMNFFFQPREAGARNAELVIDAPQLQGLTIVNLAGEGVAPVSTIDVVEFHNTADGQYFITADAAEIAFIDGGGLGTTWSRTGMHFNAWSRDEINVPASHPVCRFFGTPGVGPNSHFYTADATECTGVRANPYWQYEGIAFRAIEPFGFTICPGGTAIIQRLWRAGNEATASRHRYVADATLIPAMAAAGWVLEGPVFCAPQ